MDERDFQDRARSLAQAVSISRGKLIKQFVLVSPTKDSADLCKKHVHEVLDQVCVMMGNLCYTVDPTIDLQEWQRRFVEEGQREIESERSQRDENKGKQR